MGVAEPDQIVDRGITGRRIPRWWLFPPTRLKGDRDPVRLGHVPASLALDLRLGQRGLMVPGRKTLRRFEQGVDRQFNRWHVGHGGSR